MASFDGKYMTSYLIAMTMFAISLTIYEIFANKKSQKFELETEGQGHGEKKTRLVPFVWIC